MSFDRALEEFPSWTPPAAAFIPEGFHDTSWRNDIAPSLSTEVGDIRVTLWLDFESPSLREFEGGKRFLVTTYDTANGGVDETVMETDDFNEAAKAATAKVAELKKESA